MSSPSRSRRVSRKTKRLIEENDSPTRRRSPRSPRRKSSWRGGATCPKPKNKKCSRPCPIYKKFPVKNSKGTVVAQREFCARTSGSPGNSKVEKPRSLLSKHKKTFAALSPDDPTKQPKGVYLKTTTDIVRAMTDLDNMSNTQSDAQLKRAISKVDEAKGKLDRQVERLQRKGRRIIRERNR